MIPMDTKEVATVAFRALRGADFSAVAHVQSVWSDPSFIDENLHEHERVRILSAFAGAPELEDRGPLV
jgi:hypothetical protein